MSILDQLYEKAKQNPQKVAFPEAANEKMMQAAYETGKDEGVPPSTHSYLLALNFSTLEHLWSLHRTKDLSSR